jgi:ABC-type Zn uptake system ZnuABC Zn-binding protein ZnuA
MLSGRVSCVKCRFTDLFPPGLACAIVFVTSRFRELGKSSHILAERFEMKPWRGQKVVTYHRSFPNFAKHFGLNVIEYVEPRPGIPPSPGHTIEVIQLMKRENCKVVLVEPYFDLKTPQSIGRETGAQVVVYLPSVGGEKQVTNYFELFDYDIGLLIKALQASR